MAVAVGTGPSVATAAGVAGSPVSPPQAARAITDRLRIANIPSQIRQIRAYSPKGLLRFNSQVRESNCLQAKGSLHSTTGRPRERIYPVHSRQTADGLPSIVGDHIIRYGPQVEDGSQRLASQLGIGSVKIAREAFLVVPVVVPSQVRLLRCI